MSTAYFYLTEEGRNLANKLAAAHPGDLYDKTDFREQLTKAFHTYDSLVCIMATGIVVRILAPLLVHKTKDPAVVVLDQNGRFAISLLSGHLGGANELAREMAYLSGGQPVITTATDVAGELSFDTFAQKYDMAIQNIHQLKYISGAFLDHKPVQVFTNRSYEELIKTSRQHKMTLLPLGRSDSRDPSLPTVIIDEGFSFPEGEIAAKNNADEINTDREPNAHAGPVLYLRPRTIYAGIGCKKNMDASSIREALLAVLKKEGLHPLSLKSICTIPLKAEEPGILTTARQLDVPLTIVQTEEIAQLDVGNLGIQTSDFVASKTGVLSVSTASAYLASGKGKILVDKAKFKGVTIALCQATCETDSGGNL